MPRDDIGAQTVINNLAVSSAIAVGGVALLAHRISMDNDWERANNHFDLSRCMRAAICAERSRRAA